jgi:hypothetical protein
LATVENLKVLQGGVNGNRIVTTTISRVAINRYFPGLLLKKDLRVTFEKKLTAKP